MGLLFCFYKVMLKYFSHVTILKPLVEKGFNVFVFDYSGFGYSEGKAKRKQLPKQIISYSFQKLIA